MNNDGLQHVLLKKKKRKVMRINNWPHKMSIKKLYKITKTLFLAGSLSIRVSFRYFASQ